MTAANEPEFDVPPRPTTDEEIAELPVLDPALLDPAATKLGRYASTAYLDAKAKREQTEANRKAKR